MGSHMDMLLHMHKTRGIIIDNQITVERIIDFYLSKTLSKDEQTEIELRDWVFTERIAFEPKLQIFKLVVSKHNPEFEVNNKDYWKALNSIMQIRNIMAHWLLINDNTSIDLYEKQKTFSFAKFKNDAQMEYVGQRHIVNIMDIFSKYIPALMELLDSE